MRNKILYSVLFFLISINYVQASDMQKMYEARLQEVSQETDNILKITVGWFKEAQGPESRALLSQKTQDEGLPAMRTLIGDLCRIQQEIVAVDRSDVPEVKNLFEKFACKNDAIFDLRDKIAKERVRTKALYALAPSSSQREAFEAAVNMTFVQMDEAIRKCTKK